MHNVLVLGGYGFFGTRICMALARNPSTRLFIAGRAATDEAERKAIYDELQLILADELPAIPFYQRVLVGGMNKRIQDGDQLFFDWNRPYDLGIEKVWIKEA